MLIKLAAMQLFEMLISRSMQALFYLLKCRMRLNMLYVVIEVRIIIGMHSKRFYI